MSTYFCSEAQAPCVVGHVFSSSPSRTSSALIFPSLPGYAEPLGHLELSGSGCLRHFLGMDAPKYTCSLCNFQQYAELFKFT